MFGVLFLVDSIGGGGCGGWEDKEGSIFLLSSSSLGTSNVLNKEDPLFIFTALPGVIGESIVDHASELQSENSVEVLIESVKEVDLLT